MNSDEVLDWIHFANTTSSAKWGHILTPKLLWPISCLFLKFGKPFLVRVLMLNF